MKRILTVLIIFGFIYNSRAQETQLDINNYKYVIIPLKFEFVKGKNKYRLSTLTKVLFKESGYLPLINEEQLPEDLFKDRCLGMYADVVEVAGGFRKKNLQIILKDCYGEKIISSEVGSSGDNNHERAHQEALKSAFRSIGKLSYSYQPKANNDEEKSKTTEDEMIELTEKEAVEKVETKTKVVIDRTHDSKTEIIATETREDEVLYYAQPIENGFQLVDTTPKKVMVLLKTAKPHLFIVKGKDAIVYAANGIWIYSETDDKGYDSYPINIKF